MIPCPDCGSDQIVGHEDMYANTPGLEDIVYAECQDCDAGFDVRVTAEGVALAPVLYIPGCGTCTCADHDPLRYETGGGCGCTACTQLALQPATCPERLGAGVGLYDGMCDECYELAREVRMCGLRVAEHEAVTQ